MRKITCENCGDQDFIKQGDFFICNHCGIGYTVEEVGKMLAADHSPAHEKNEPQEPEVSDETIADKTTDPVSPNCPPHKALGFRPSYRKIIIYVLVAASVLMFLFTILQKTNVIPDKSSAKSQAKYQMKFFIEQDQEKPVSVKIKSVIVDDFEGKDEDPYGYIANLETSNVKYISSDKEYKNEFEYMMSKGIDLREGPKRAFIIHGSYRSKDKDSNITNGTFDFIYIQDIKSNNFHLHKYSYGKEAPTDSLKKEAEGDAIMHVTLNSNMKRVTKAEITTIDTSISKYTVYGKVTAIDNYNDKYILRFTAVYSKTGTDYKLENFEITHQEKER